MSKGLKTSVMIAAFTMLLSAGCAHHMSMTPTVPERLAVLDNQSLAFALQGRGVQIYTCKAAANDPARFEWAFVAPEAVLSDDHGNKVGKHYAGPTWEANDGSKVTGEVLAKDTGPDPSAIPWLLLHAKKNTGSGIFTRITSIQRLNTRGGKAPEEGCPRAKAGTELRIPYTADYYFYAARY